MNKLILNEKLILLQKNWIRNLIFSFCLLGTDKRNQLKCLPIFETKINLPGLLLEVGGTPH